MTFNENKAIALQAEENGDYFSAVHFYKEAIQIAQKAGNSSEIKFLKQKIVELVPKIEMKQVSFEQPLDQKTVNETRDFVTKMTSAENINEVLDGIGTSASLYPQKKSIPTTPMPVSLQIASLATFTEKGHTVAGGSDPRAVWSNKLYSISFGLEFSLMTWPIFHKLLEREDFNSDNVFKYFVDKEIATESELGIVKIGIGRYFEGDFVSALHILVPQFERIFLDFSEKCGVDIISFRALPEGAITTQPRTLSSENLKSENFISKWGEDFCRLLDYVLFDSLGVKLRHQVAHGEVQISTCDFENTTTILFLYIKLFNRIKRVINYDSKGN